MKQAKGCPSHECKASLCLLLTCNDYAMQEGTKTSLRNPKANNLRKYLRLTSGVLEIMLACNVNLNEITENKLSNRHKTNIFIKTVIFLKLKLKFIIQCTLFIRRSLNSSPVLMFIGPCIIVIVENKRPT